MPGLDSPVPYVRKIESLLRGSERMLCLQKQRWVCSKRTEQQLGLCELYLLGFFYTKFNKAPVLNCPGSGGKTMA